MDCWEYRTNYLAADADGELNAEEQRVVRAHLSECPDCRALVKDERALKALLRERLRRVSLPSEIRAAIGATLDRDDAGSRPLGWLVGLIPEFRRRPQLWAPVAAIAIAILLLVTIRAPRTKQTPTSDFDVAIEKFSGFEKHFEPNVPSDSYGSIGETYNSHDMPGMLWNFEPLGYRLVGGRIDPLPNGRPATYTFYRGPKGAVMCTRFQVDEVVIPPGGHLMHPGQYAYSYKGFSLILSVDYARRWVCILMSRVPEREFAKEIDSLQGD